MLYGFGANEYGVLVLKKPSVEEKDSSNAYDESKSDSNNNAPFNDDLFELTPLLTLPNQKTLSSRSATTPTTPTTHSVSVDSFDKYQIRKLVANNEFAAIVLSSSEGELYASGKNVSSIYSSWSSQPYVNNNKNNHWQCNQLLEPFIRIGQGLNGQKIKNIATGNRFVVAQTVYGQLYVCGSFVGRVPLMDCEHFSPLDPYLPATLKSSAGYCHCGIISRQDGLLYVIGDNDSGELGLGHQRDRNRWTLVSFISERVKSIDFGNHNSIAIGESGNIYVAGSNLNGELGISTLDNDYVKVFTKAEITKCNRNEKAQKTACGMHHVVIISLC
ncbi:hypothetical protein FDP41_006398 [Naegleria fowleri]|uniref:Uncharacterized protein n=1 Tax=Naegleria fowleri TaxID=5763 RepID=A0A6A5BHZ3_NAEFO|nr:uncharacterized protein FDP41_006398 [Naegleria fowleri]KAF0974366.1 hypothetical protein FDP41_006398 [Naegleria fowleri]